MPSVSDVLSLTSAELGEHLKALGEQPYRTAQIFEWIYHKNAFSFDEMSNLPQGLRVGLAGRVPFPVLFERDRRIASDKTVKFLLELADQAVIEAVLIPTSKRNTLCVSSQAGCRFGCRFCASGLQGLQRNLTCGEIVAEILHVRRMFPKVAVSHIVFMGTGEPFDNYDNVMKAVRLINGKEGFNIAARHITISTCGLIPGIERFSGEGLQVELSVSLHAPNDVLRLSLMPVNQRYPLRDLLAACRAYAARTNRQVTFEYLLIKDQTCTSACAVELAGLMKGWLAKVNLIPYNPVNEFLHLAPLRSDVLAFQQELERRGVICTLRSSRGSDIAAACGQLRILNKR